MKICILGAGMLGKELYMELKDLYKVRLYDYPEIDICNKEQLEKHLPQYDVIINCAAYTNVDKADEEVLLCQKINFFGVKNLAEVCKQHNLKLIHFSTAYVYGNKEDHLLNENDVCKPLNSYGSSKRDSEFTIIETVSEYLILRINWLYGQYKETFISKAATACMQNKSFKIVDDQIGNLTSVHTVLTVVQHYLNNKIPSGLYNCCDAGDAVNKYDVVKFIFELLHGNVNKVIPVKSSEFPGALRPSDCSMDCSKLDAVQGRNLNNDWKLNIIHYLKKLEFPVNFD